MSHCKNRVASPTDEIAHSKCLQAVFCKAAESRTEKLCFIEERCRASLRRKVLKHRGNGDVSNAEKEQLESSFGCGGPCPSPSSATLYTSEKLSGRKSGARGSECQAGSRGEFYVKRETSTSRRFHGVLERSRGCEG